jgi:hypothetical protein
MINDVIPTKWVRSEQFYRCTLHNADIKYIGRARRWCISNMGPIPVRTAKKGYGRNDYSKWNNHGSRVYDPRAADWLHWLNGSQSEKLSSSDFLFRSADMAVLFKLTWTTSNG